jgi:septin family protein
MQDLKDVTDDLHYEAFRTKYIRLRNGSLNQVNLYQNVDDNRLNVNEKAEKLLQEKEIEVKQGLCL